MQRDEHKRFDSLQPDSQEPSASAPIGWAPSVRRIVIFIAAAWLIPLAVALLLS